MVLLIGIVFGGGYLLIDHFRTDSGGDAGGPVAGQLRGTFPEKPSVGWQLSGDEVFDRAEFVRPDPTSVQYQVPGVIDLGDTLVTSAILPQTDRGASLVAIDASSGRVRWISDAGFKPVCATAVVDGLLPCLGKEAVFGPAGSSPPPKVSFVRMSDGAIDHQIAVSEFVRAVEVHGSAVYTMAFDYEQMVRAITKGTVDDLTADWDREYPLSRDHGCIGSGDWMFDGVAGDLVYTGEDGGLAVAGTGDGKLMAPPEVTDLKVFGEQGFTVRQCGEDPYDISTLVIDADGRTLRSIGGSESEYVADPWLLEPGVAVPYIIGGAAYDFATGDRLWSAQDAGTAPWTIVGDTVVGSNSAGSMVGHDLATGTRLWTSIPYGDGATLSDGQRVLVAGESGLTAVDLATGDEVWTLNSDRSTRFAAAGDGFVEVAGRYMNFYPPTGGPSVVPGRADPVASNTDGAGGLITKCGNTPEMRPVQYRAEGGALFLRMEVKALCPGGDIVSTDRLRVTVRDERGLICSGEFDFSRDPLILGGDGAEPTQLELKFGQGTFARHPNTLGSGTGSGGIVTEADASGNEVVDCVDEGSSAGPQSAGSATRDATVQTRPDQTGGPASGCGSDDDALAALRAQIDTDRPYVQSELANRWVAQLSSKQPGLVAPDVDGRVLTWTPCEILQQHLRMRGQYPEVRLVWSDEWRTFDLRGWWVTVAGLTFPDADAANGWCDSRGIPVDECYAKVISNTEDSRGTTKYRR
ncbi:pyrrolo-quinoline quinone [Mycobacterium sp. EPG1]|nr:pyrrolo-quinoline quinone [Mycobacterium sp. EPG1]